MNDLTIREWAESATAIDAADGLKWDPDGGVSEADALAWLRCQTEVIVLPNGHVLVADRAEWADPKPASNDVSLEETAEALQAAMDAALGDSDSVADIIVMLSDEDLAEAYLVDLEGAGVYVGNVRAFLADLYDPERGGTPNPDCEECQRSYGPHYRGHCPH